MFVPHVEREAQRCLNLQKCSGVTTTRNDSNKHIGSSLYKCFNSKRAQWRDPKHAPIHGRADECIVCLYWSPLNRVASTWTHCDTNATRAAPVWRQWGCSSPGDGTTLVTDRLDIQKIHVQHVLAWKPMRSKYLLSRMIMWSSVAKLTP